MLTPGARVIVEIRDGEIYEGQVIYCNKTSVELGNVFCQSSSTDYEGNITFYKNEIVKIASITSTNGEADSSDETENIKMHPDEFYRLKQMTYDFIFVDSFGKRFNDAVEVLKNRESVAVVGLGNGLSRGKPLSLLLMSDFKQVYIFDLFCLVQMRELKDILESHFICKVVHGGSALYDCLYHKYKIDMQNVFDTQLTDKMLSGTETAPRNISECLTHHFNFPPSLLSAAVDDLFDKIWLERPMLKSNKIRAAQLVTYLLTLRDKLMEQILNPYTSAMKKDYLKYRNLSDSELLIRKIS